MGQRFGPDFTFLGVPRCDLDDPASYADADVVIVGAPFDGGTSYRSGARFGPAAIRGTDYLGHDGSRPSLALRTDGLQDLKVYDAGDVEMYSGTIETALPALEAVVEKVVRAGAIPVSLGGDHSIAYPDAKGCANVRVRGAAGRPVPADRVARLLAAAGHPGLDGRAADAVLRDDRDRPPRLGRVPDRSVAIAIDECEGVSFRSTSTCAIPATPRAPVHRSRAG